MSADEDDSPALSVRELAQRRAVEESKRPRPPSKERSYPLMRALLSNPDVVPYGTDPSPRPTVPGTFIPARDAPADNEPDVDDLLESMADGLLIGGDGARQEVRIALRDDFFRGTELRIAIHAGAVEATLHPPDMDTFVALRGEVDRLREQLEARGLTVSKVHLQEP